MDLPIVHCPSDRGYRGFHLKTLRDSKLSSFEHFGTSYTSNGIWGVSGAYTTVMSCAPFLRGASAVPAPGQTLLYLDDCARFAWYLDDDTFNWGFANQHAHDNGLDKSRRSIRPWHGQPHLYNTAFVDGHAAVTKINGRKIPPPRLSRYPLTDEWGGEEGNGEAWYIYYRGAIIRGSGWQVDCLPGPIIVTDIPAAPPMTTSGPFIG